MIELACSEGSFGYQVENNQLRISRGEKFFKLELGEDYSDNEFKIQQNLFENYPRTSKIKVLKSGSVNHTEINFEIQDTLLNSDYHLCLNLTHKLDLANHLKTGQIAIEIEQDLPEIDTDFLRHGLVWSFENGVSIEATLGEAGKFVILGEMEIGKGESFFAANTKFEAQPRDFVFKVNAALTLSSIGFNLTTHNADDVLPV